jgi:nucleoside-diphosphate-sugar epimerase
MPGPDRRARDERYTERGLCAEQCSAHDVDVERTVFEKRSMIGDVQMKMTDSSASAAGPETVPAREAPGDATGRHVVLGAGPVARAVVEQLAQQGIRPVVVTRSGTQVAAADSRRADVADPAAATDALAGAAVVYQAAQPAYHRWVRDFPALQRSILEAAARAGAVLVAVENLYGYGPVEGPIRPDLPLAATTRKGRLRAAMWHELETAHRAGRVRTVAARASDFYGPGVTASVYGERFFAPLVAGKGAEVLGDPERLHAVTLVDDLAALLVRLGATPDAWGRAWHVPNAPAVTQRRIVELAAEAAGVPARIRRISRAKLRLGGLMIPEARETVEMLYEFEHDFLVDDTGTRERLGLEPTPLADGLAATVAWYRTRQ